MKRNLLSILIFALLVVNIALTAITMINVNRTAASTNALVADIASVLNLEVNGPVSNLNGNGSDVAIENTVVYNISESMTIPLAVGEDGGLHYCIVSVSLSIDSKNKDYEAYADGGIAEKEELIKGEIIEAISEYTLEEARADTDGIKQNILDRIQKLFNSRFIYKVTFGEVLWQ